MHNTTNDVSPEQTIVTRIEVIPAISEYSVRRDSVDFYEQKILKLKSYPVTYIYLITIFYKLYYTYITN